MIRRLLSLVAVLAMVSVDARAVVPGDAEFNQARTQLRADSVILSGWLADQFKFAIPFNSTMGGALAPSQLKIFGFEVGIAAGVSGTEVDVDGLRRLNTSLINSNDIDSVDTLPFPSVIGHAKIGLPFGIDAGVRIGGIPEKEVDEGDTTVKLENKIIGFDLRKKIIEEGATKPFGLTLGLSYTHAQGDITATSQYTESTVGTVSTGGNTYTTDLVATGTNTMEWDTNSWGLSAILNKKILFFNPYLGASATRNFGSVTNSLTNAGTVTLTNAGDSVARPYSETGAASRDANKWDVRALLGAEFSILPFLKLGLHGEYAGSKNIAGLIGLRGQFR